MGIKNQIVLTLLLLSFAQSLVAQSYLDSIRIDSLKNALQVLDRDSHYVNTILELNATLRRTDLKKESISFAEESYKVSQKLSWTKGMADSQESLGLSYESLYEYDKAEEAYLLMLDIWEEEENTLGIIDSYYNLGIVCYMIGEFEKSLAYYYKAMEIPQEEWSKLKYSKALNVIGTIHYRMSNYDKAIPILNQSLKLKREIGDPRQISMTLNNLALVHNSIADYRKSLELNEESMAIKLNNNDIRGVATSLLNIGNIYADIGEYENAEEYYHKCVNIADSLQSDFILATAYHSLAIVYFDLRDIQNSIEYYDKAFALQLEIGDQEKLADLHKGLGDVYFYNGEYQNAILNFQEANKIAYEIGVIILQIRSHLKLANSYLILNRNKLALSNYQKAKYLSDGNISHELKVATHEGLAKYYTKNQQFKNALFHQKQYSLYKDSLLNDDKLKDVAQAEVRIVYNRKIKEDSLSYANAQQVLQLRHEVEIQESWNKLVLSMFISGFMFFLLVGGYWLYVIIKRKNILLEIQKEEINEKSNQNEFLVKEIHHRVKNNLQILSSLLSLQSNYITNDEAAEAIKEGRNRVESMGMIHQRLYSGEDKSAIDMTEYIDDVCAYLEDSFLLKDRKVNIVSNCEVGLADVETVIPLGLIINELITNSIKYAFDEGEEGEINVTLTENKNDQLCLIVSDDGKGMQEDNEHKKRSTNFGSDLVNVLIKKLKGTLTQNVSDGYTTTIVFDRYNLIES